MLPKLVGVLSVLFRCLIAHLPVPDRFFFRSLYRFAINLEQVSLVGPLSVFIGLLSVSYRFLAVSYRSLIGPSLVSYRSLTRPLAVPSRSLIGPLSIIIGPLAVPYRSFISRLSVPCLFLIGPCIFAHTFVSHFGACFVVS